MAELKSHVDRAFPTPTHAFFKTLASRGTLRRVYSQNIDGLEAKVGLKPVRVEGCVPSRPGRDEGKGKKVWEGEYVALHGSVGMVRCTACDYVGAWEEDHGEAFRKGETMDCPSCLSVGAFPLLFLPLPSFRRVQN